MPLEKVRVRSDQIRSRNSAAFTRAADECNSSVMMRIDDWPISICNRATSMMPGWAKATAGMTRLRQM